MEKYNVWTPINFKYVPVKDNIFTSTWAMKKISSVVNRARMNFHGYDKVDGVHYDSANITSPVTNDIRIKIVLVLVVMAACTTKILDIKLSFLHGKFTEN